MVFTCCDVVSRGKQPRARAIVRVTHEGRRSGLAGGLIWLGKRF